MTIIVMKNLTLRSAHLMEETAFNFNTRNASERANFFLLICIQAM